MRELSRRQLIGWGLATLGGTVAAGAIGLPGSVTAAGAATTSPSLATWKSLVGKKVTVTTRAGRRSSLVVRSASALRRDPLLEGSGYVVRFRGVRRPVLPQARSVLSSPSFGRFAVVLLPINKPTDRQSYQLIVDQRRPVRTSWR